MDHSIIKLVVPRPSGETEILSVHQGVLCKSSEFFKCMMEPEWAASRDSPNIIELPDETFETVSDYVKWLYAGRMPLTLYKADADGKGEKVAEEAEKVFVLLAEAYALGEKSYIRSTGVHHLEQLDHLGINYSYRSFAISDLLYVALDPAFLSVSSLTAMGKGAILSKRIVTTSKVLVGHRCHHAAYT
ncbi:hypothetical protein PMIN06_012041 [Paraphaeosphaeria minitans]